MKYYLKYFLLIFLLIFIGGCFERNSSTKKEMEERFEGFKKVITNAGSIPEIIPEKSLTKITIPDDSHGHKINIDEMLDSVFYVKLETTDSCLIGKIDKLLFHSNKILVVENDRRLSILLFSTDGKFISKIGRLGQGPGEYVSIRDVAIDHINKNVVVLDASGKKLLYYDMNGDFLKEQRLFYYPTSLAVLNDGSILFAQYRNVNSHIPSVVDNMLLFSENSNLTITGKTLSFTYRDKFKNIDLQSHDNFNVTASTVLFNQYFNDTIYEIKSSNKITAKYVIDMGDKNITSVFNAATTKDDFAAIVNANKHYHFKGLALETDDYFYCNINSFHSCYYSKRKEKVLYYGGGFITAAYGINDAKLRKYIRMGYPMTTFNNYFVSVISSESIEQDKNYNMQAIIKSKYRPDVEAIMSETKSDDNPVLFFYSLK